MNDDDTRDDTGPWVPLLTAQSTADDVYVAAEKLVRISLDDVSERLLADPDLTARDRARVLSYVEPFLRGQSRAALFEALADLRAQAPRIDDDADTAGTVH